MDFIQSLFSSRSLGGASDATGAKTATSEAEQAAHFEQQLHNASAEFAPLPEHDTTASTDKVLENEHANVLLPNAESPLSDTDSSQDDAIAQGTSQDDNATDEMDEGDDIDHVLAQGAVFLQRLTQSNQQIASHEPKGGNPLPPEAPTSVTHHNTDDIGDDAAEGVTSVLTGEGPPSSKHFDITPSSAVAERNAVTSLHTTPHGVTPKNTPHTVEGHHVMRTEPVEENDDGVGFLPSRFESEHQKALEIPSNLITAKAVMPEIASSEQVLEAVKRTLVDAPERDNETPLAASLSSAIGASSASAMKMEPHVSAAQAPLMLTKEQAGEQVSERIQMMMAKNLKQVDIRLDPPELGKIQIKLSINNDQATVQFSVNNNQTRDMLEQAMPRLREMMQQQGMQLAQGSVHQESSQSFAQHQQNSPQQEAGFSSAMGGNRGEVSDAHDEIADTATELYITERNDRVDFYA